MIAPAIASSWDGCVGDKFDEYKCENYVRNVRDVVFSGRKAFWNDYFVFWVI